MTNKDLVLQSIEHCNRVEPIMTRFGIEPDAQHLKRCSDNKWVIRTKDNKFQNGETYYANGIDYPIPTYRQDKLESVLPEWCFAPFADNIEDSEDCDIYWDLPEPELIFEHECNEVGREVHELLYKILTEPGEPRRIATVELAELLDQKGLLPKEEQ